MSTQRAQTEPSQLPLVRVVVEDSQVATSHGQTIYINTPILGGNTIPIREAVDLYRALRIVLKHCGVTDMER